MVGKLESTRHKRIHSLVEKTCSFTKIDASGQRDHSTNGEAMADDLEANISNFHWVEERESKQPLFSSSGMITSMTDVQNERLASLDVFRGLTVGAMILVDYAGGLWSGINHAPWNGITFADYVVPAFLFIVGLSLTFSHKKFHDRRRSAYKIMLRFLKLVGVGLILQGGYLHGVKDLSYGVDLQLLRIMGVLQRIAIAYAVVALLEICSSKDYIPDPDESFFGIVRVYRWQWVAAFVVTFIYAGLLYGLYVPDWEFAAPSEPGYLYTSNSSLSANSSLLVACNVRGSLSPGCNAVGFVDRYLLGISHMYRHPAYKRSEACSLNFPYNGPLPDDAPTWCVAPFDPEGLLSSLMGIVTCFIGAHYGHVLLHVKGRKKQLRHWVISASVLTLVGLLLTVAGMPLNKNLYTVSYTCVTGGVVALSFIAVFVLVDVYKWRSSAALFKYIGEHALMIYALLASGVLPMALQGLYWKSPENNLIRFILSSVKP